jgi:hypothetical protein
VEDFGLATCQDMVIDINVESLSISGQIIVSEKTIRNIQLGLRGGSCNPSYWEVGI